MSKGHDISPSLFAGKLYQPGEIYDGDDQVIVVSTWIRKVSLWTSGCYVRIIEKLLLEVSNEKLPKVFTFQA
jgi:hypothetical protein